MCLGAHGKISRCLFFGAHVRADQLKLRGCAMAEIRPLPDVDEPLLRRLITGYSATEVHRVARYETPNGVRFELGLAQLEQPFVKHYPLDADAIEQYRGLARAGHAFGALVNGECAGIAICDPQPWNRSLIVLEFHIAPDVRRSGIGRQLMSAVEQHARTLGMRSIVCETQNTNVPAIRFYRALGFTIDGIDVSLYTNDDLAHGEVALLLKRRVDDTA
jgi:ribosomal protein S18 acetylase RimI-like enzyme